MIYNQLEGICNRQLSMESDVKPAARAGRSALLLLLAINLFNYIDRQVLAAVEPDIRATFFAPNDPNAMAISGLLGDAFLITYMISAPILGWLADRFSRWVIVGSAVIIWSLASGASGLAQTFTILFITRIFVGIGEGGYGPAAPTILSDLFPIAKRGSVMAAFCAAIPVGSALGYVLGGLIGTHFGWRWAFYAVVLPGLLLGLICFTQHDPPRTGRPAFLELKRRRLHDYLMLFRSRSYVTNTIAQTITTFVLGGLGFWIPAYLRFRNQSPARGMTIFGGIVVVAGLVSTLLGGVLADKLRPRFPGSDFLVSGVGMIIACPLFITSLYLPFPAAWFVMFVAIFFMFLNTGPSNTAIANVSLPHIRASAFALNIFIIHAFGDVPAFPTIGYIAGHSDIRIAFVFVSFLILIAGAVWIFSVKYLPPDVAAVEAASGEEQIPV